MYKLIFTLFLQNGDVVDMSLAFLPSGWMFKSEQDLLVNFIYLFDLVLQKS